MKDSSMIDITVQRKAIGAKATAIMPLAPVELWTLLAVPESRHVFRVESRKQLSDSDGRITEQVVFEAPVRILFWKKWARTQVHQVVDMSDPTAVTVHFKLMRSDMMSHLVGTWHFQQLEAPCKGSLGRTQVTYCFEMWPKGVPTALRLMPGLLDVVKSAVTREASQLFDKLAFVAGKVQPGGCLLEAARQASAEVIAAGGSFKCLQLQQAGHTAEAAAAAAAEAAARQELKQQQQQKVVCHALEDVSSEDDDDTLVMMDSCDSNISNLSSSSSMAVEEFGKIGGKGRGRCSSSSGSSEGRVSAAGSVSSISSGGSSFGQLVMAMSTSFSDMMRPAAAN